MSKTFVQRVKHLFGIASCNWDKTSFRFMKFVKFSSSFTIAPSISFSRHASFIALWMQWFPHAIWKKNPFSSITSWIEETWTLRLSLTMPAIMKPSFFNSSIDVSNFSLYVAASPRKWENALNMIGFKGYLSKSGRNWISLFRTYSTPHFFFFPQKILVHHQKILVHPHKIKVHSHKYWMRFWTKMDQKIGASLFFRYLESLSWALSK